MTRLSPRPTPAPVRRLRAKRARLMASAAGGALALLASTPDAARAQAINATPATTGGNVTYSRFTAPTPNAEIITVETPQAIINWTPTAPASGPWVFLPGGNVVTFQNGVSVTNFAVLNRILPTLGAARFDGRVVSRLRDVSGNVTGFGGTVVFSSPGGIIVGPTGAFDVGSLVLTTLNVADDGNGNFLSPNGGFQYELSGDSSSGSIVTAAGSRIDALTGGSYVALVAPQVTHGGAIRVDGSAAFIGAEQVSFSVNEGLFDIQVTTGSGNATPIVHTGSTGGPASAGGTDNHGIYMVAVPKNQAITMLLEGSVGFDAATDVTVENGVIILSAGYNVSGTQIASRSNSDLPASIEINGGTYTSDVVGQASGDATATATQGDPLAFDGDLSLQAAGRAALIADASSTASVDGDLELIGIDPNTRRPGEARLEARTGAVVTLGGNVTLSADHFPSLARLDSIPLIGQSTQGGTAALLSQGGSITIAGGLDVTASASGGLGTSAGGNATGGTASVEANGGSIDVTGTVNILAVALGGSSQATSGNGTGGTARLSSLGGSVDIGGLLFMSASAVGGLGRDGPPTIAGTSRGGTATVEAFAFEGSGGTIAVDGGTFLLADGGQLLLPPGAFGSEGPLLINSGGTGEGGSVNVLVRGGSLASPSLLLFARGIGGDVATPPFGNGRAGYAGTGGDVTIEFSDTNSNIGLLGATALGQGGDGSDGIATEGSSIGGAGGAGTGGTVDMLVQGGTTTIGSVTIGAPGTGGAGGAGGFDGLSAGGTGGLGTGGEAIVTAGAGGRLLTSSLSVEASGDGGVGGAGSFGFDVGGVGGAGGAGVGGLAEVGTTGGDIVISGVESELRIAAIGFGGTGGTGGQTTGDAGPGGDGGGGGSGTGGTAQIDIAGGSITTPRTSVDGSGSGGAGGSAGANPFFTGTSGANGNGEGGLSRIAIADGLVVPGSASLGFTFMSASGFSGSGFSTLADTAGLMVIADTASGDVLLDELEAISDGQASPDGPAFQFTSSNGPVEVSGPVTVDVVGDVDIAAFGTGGLQATGAVSILTDGSIDLSHDARAADSETLAGASVTLTAQGDIVGAPGSLIAASTGDAQLSATSVDVGLVTAGRDAFINASDIAVDSVVAGRDVTLFAGGDIDVGFAQAGDDFLAEASGTFTGGTVVTTGLGEDTEVDSSSFLAGSTIDVFAGGDVRLDNGDAFDDLNLTSISGNVLSAGLLDSGGDMRLRAGADTGDIVDILINDASAGGFMSLSAPGALVADVLTAGGDITANLGTDAFVNSIDTGGSLLLFADGVVDLGTVVAAGNVLIDPISIDIDSVEAGGDITLDADDFIRVGFAQAGDDFTATAGGTFTGGTVIATGLGPDSDDSFPGSNIVVDAGGDLRLDNGSAPDTIDLASATGSVLSGGLLTADQLIVSAALNIDLNDVDVVDTLSLSAPNGFIDGNSFTTDGALFLNAAGAVTVNAASSGGSQFVTSGATADLGTLVSGLSITIAAPTILLDSATAFLDIDLSSPGDITVGFAQAGDDFTASAGGLFTGGTVIATGLGPDDEEGFGTLGFSNIVIDSAGNLTLTNGDAANDIRLTSTDASVFSAGLLDAGRDIDVAAIDVVDLATLVAGRNVTVDPVTIIIDSVTAGGDITLDASADITVGFAQAGDDFSANAGTTFTGTTVIATGLGVDSEQGVGPLAGSGNILVNAGADLRLDNGDAALDIRLTSRAGSILSSTLLEAGRDVFADAALDIDVTNIDAGGFVSLVARGGFVDAQSILAGGSISTSSAADTRVDFADAGDFISLTAGGAALLGTLAAGEDIFVDALRITLAGGTAGSDISLFASEDISVTSAAVGDDFEAIAGTTFAGTTITSSGTSDDDLVEGPFPGNVIYIRTAGELRLDTGTTPGLIDLASSGGSILSGGTLTADTLLAVAAFDLLLNDVFVVQDLDLSALNGRIAGNSFNSDGDILLAAAGAIDLASADAGDDFVASAGGAFTAGTVAATGLGADSEGGSGALAGANIQVTAGGDLRLDNGNAAAAIRLSSTGGSILSSTLLDAGTDLFADAALDIDVTGIEAGGFVSLVAFGGFVDAQSILAGGSISTSSADDTRIDFADAGGFISLSAGGAALLGTLAAGDDISVDALRITLAGGTAGSDISLFASEDISVTSAAVGDDFEAIAGTTFAGTTITSSGASDDDSSEGPFPGNVIYIRTAGDLRLDTGTTPGLIDLGSSGGNILSFGTLTADTLLAVAAFDLRLNDVFVVSDLDLATVAGDITGNSFNSDGDIRLGSSGGVALNSAVSGGDITIAAAGDLRLNFGTAPGLIELASAAGSIFSAGTLNSGALNAEAGLDLVLNNVFVVADLVLATPNGSISGNLFDSGGDILLDASGTIRVASADSGGTIDFTGGGDVRLDRGRADEAIVLTSTAGSVFSDPLDGGGGGDGGLPLLDGLLDAGTDVILTAALDVTIDDARAGDTILIDAGRNTTVRNLTAAQSIDVDAGGNAAFAGAARAPAIAVASADIDIASGASLGDSATQLVSLTALGTGQQTVLGGSTEGPGYTLTDAEADRIAAAILRIEAPPAGTAANRPADVLVRDLSLAGAQVGLFDLRTSGIVQVAGGLLMSGVRPGGGIEIRATERIEVVNPSGSVRVRDGAGLTDGNLLLSSNNVWSASQGLLDQLRADPNFAGRDQALLVNDGPVAPRGYIEAGDVVLAARDTLFVQNSGGVIAFAGITVRESTLRILPTGSLPLKVFAFGRRINPDGSFVTNNAFFGEVVFEGRGGPVGYAEDAQFNLCFINSGVCRLPIGNPVPGGPDIVEEPVDGSDTTTTLQLGREELVDTSFADEPLIEEPVTSGSDSILWDCDRDDDGDCDEEDNDG